MGLFDAKVFDLFRDDEGDAAAAQSRADRQQSKADSNQAIADAKSGIDEVDVPSESAAVAAPVVAAPGGGAVAVVSQSPEWGRMARAVRKLAETVKAQEQRLAEVQAEGAAVTAELAKRQTRIVKGASMLVDKLREQDSKRASSALFLSDGVMSALSGFVAVINVSDEIQSPTMKALAASLQALIASDTIEGAAETWLRTGQLLAETLAYYDVEAGLTSVITPEGSGSILGSSASLTSSSEVALLRDEVALLREEVAQLRGV